MTRTGTRYQVQEFADGKWWQLWTTEDYALALDIARQNIENGSDPETIRIVTLEPENGELPADEGRARYDEAQADYESSLEPDPSDWGD